ncbi:hypothetical protein RSOLAG22IIIB_12564 [Rhizoctonia solani]|uniref:2OGFeDO JBP1/TET oxygenase domain-containing protein n=1 Tax=Rhizoctonia solani TaxID=456999 RepID=A0A0K6GF80_9AGAM|nr:hypothetical protein RSOLAG22IIIB_12564 [Rhizoctonia solani]
MAQELARDMKKYEATLGPHIGDHWRTEGDDRYLVNGNPHGCRHWAKAWNARGHQFSNDPAPSSEVLLGRSVDQICGRIQSIIGLKPLAGRINDLLSKAHPRFFDLLCSMEEPLNRYAGAQMIGGIWESKFPGLAVLMNKESGEHLDMNGVRRGWDVLLALGDFEGGSLYLRDLNVRVPFLPGTLVAFDGTRQRHLIEEFTGCQRISLVHFVHKSTVLHAGLSPSLPDLNLQDIVSQVSPPTQVLAKRKKTSRGVGHRFRRGAKVEEADTKAKDATNGEYAREGSKRRSVN